MTYEELCRRLYPLYEAGEAKAIVRYVLEVRFGLSLADILCGKMDGLPTSDQEELEATMLRLETGEPVQYVLGVADFCGRQFHVEPGVLIPRPETEELCRWIIKSEELRVKSEESCVLDIGTGSGCIAITLALEMPEAKVTAWDISDDALRIAAENAAALKAHVAFEHRDILASQSHQSWGQAHWALPQVPVPMTDVPGEADSSLFALHSSLSIIVSNPPYIQPSERAAMARNVLDFEPRQALFAPADEPIIFYQRIGDFAWQNLIDGGELYFELNPLTATQVSDYLRGLGFSDIEIRDDQFGKPRFLKAKKI